MKTTTVVIGTLSVNGVFECYTLENPDVIIPEGTYGVSIYNSPHAGHCVPLLLDVPGRTCIEVHCGNVPSDSKGCILVGRQHTEDSLLESRPAFAHLFPLIEDGIKNGNGASLTISEDTK